MHLEDLPVLPLPLPSSDTQAAGTTDPESVSKFEARLVPDAPTDPVEAPILAPTPDTPAAGSPGVSEKEPRGRPGTGCLSRQLITELCYFESGPSPGDSGGERAGQEDPGASGGTGVTSAKGVLADGVYVLSL